MTHQSSEEERKGIGYADERSVHDTPNSSSPHPPIEAIERLKEAAEGFREWKGTVATVATSDLLSFISSYEERGRRLAAQAEEIERLREEANADYHRATLAEIRLVELFEAASTFIDFSLCTENPNVSDGVFVPIDMTMGEFRKLRAALSKVPNTGEQSQ